MDIQKMQQDNSLMRDKQFPILHSLVKSYIVEIRQRPVIVDADVAALYGVETKRVNEAVKNNPDKFPEDYMFVLTTDELKDLRSKNTTTNLSPKSRLLPKAFTEKGIVVSQPISDEARRKARLRRQMYDERGNGFSPYHFLLNKGKAVADETGMPLLYFEAGEIIPIGKIL